MATAGSNENAGTQPGAPTGAEGYYARRRHKLLRGFDRISKRIERSLERHYDDELARSVIADTRVEFDRIIPEIPYIGGRTNIFTPVILINGVLVALHRAMQTRGRSAEDTVRICADVSDEFFRSWPSLLLRLSGRSAFSGFARRVFRRQARRSQERRYAEDFVYTVHEGDGDDVALVFDECAVNKFYEAQGVEELKPYCNFFDVTYSRLMNMGVDATSTIGLGCETCALRYKHGRETIVPDKLKGVLKGT